MPSWPTTIAPRAAAVCCARPHVHVLAAERGKRVTSTLGSIDDIKPILGHGSTRCRARLECRRRQTGEAGQEGGRAPWQDGFRRPAARVVEAPREEGAPALPSNRP